MIYKNYKDDTINIGMLPDRDLILSYRWFLKYYNVIKKIVSEDGEYIKYIEKILKVKDGFKKEIVNRKLKMYFFK
mgnify:CR=1 FL=1